jgi:hypothetical protein
MACVIASVYYCDLNRICSVALAGNEFIINFDEVVFPGAKAYEFASATWSASGNEVL